MTRSELSPNSPRVVRKVQSLALHSFRAHTDGGSQAFRADAKSRGLSYPAAIAVTKAKDAEAGKKVQKPAGIVRRNPGRMDGVLWNGDSFVCARQVEGEGRPDARSLDDFDHERFVLAEKEWLARADKERLTLAEQEQLELAEEKEREARTAAMVVSLLDIARPAKRAKRRGTSVFSFAQVASTEQWTQA
jgi:hypothetical protein